jgi:hypothetical protein
MRTVFLPRPAQTMAVGLIKGVSARVQARVGPFRSEFGGRPVKSLNPVPISSDSPAGTEQNESMRKHVHKTWFGRFSKEPLSDGADQSFSMGLHSH